MATATRIGIRLARYYLQLLVWTLAGIGLIWLLVWAFPFLFERTKGLWELVMGEEIAHRAVVGLAALMVCYILARVADATFRDVYLAPIVGDRRAQDLPTSRLERLVLWLATIAAAAVVFLVPGAFGVLDSIGRWLPEPGSPGVVGLAGLLVFVVGTTVFLGDLWIFTWRAKPGHDLGQPRTA
jgi:hypothetical protein